MSETLDFVYPVDDSRRINEHVDLDFEAEASANTEVEVEFDNIDSGRDYVLAIINPSANTALDVKIETEFLVEGEPTDLVVAKYCISASDSQAKILDGKVINSGTKITVSNVSSLGAGEDFTGTLALYLV